MNKIKIILIAGIIGFIVIVFIVLSFLGSGSQQKPPTSQTTPTPQTFPSTALYISSITPADTSQAYLPVQPIQINFTQPINKNSLKYSVTPATESFVVSGQTANSLIIVPTTFWNGPRITITILGETISSTGNDLKNPQTYILNLAIPTIPQLEGAY